MKKVFRGLAILLIIGLVLSSSSVAVMAGSGSVKASGNDIAWNGLDDREVAETIDAVQNDTRKNASGPKITSNACSAEFPGIYFIWDSKQSDNGYLKVQASVFDKFDSFILTVKTSNTYWDFEIAVQSGQEMTGDDCFVFFIPKVKEVNKNINMVFLSEFKQNSLVPQALNYAENPVDIPNPDRGFYRANDGMVVPVSGSISGTINVGNSPVTVAGALVTTRISHIYFDLRRFSSNAFTSRGTRYTSSYRAPADVPIASRGDANPQYATHFDYWKANVLPTWAHGTSQPLTDIALAYIRDKLQQVRNGNGVAMVRFSYDGAGYGWVSVNHPQDGYIDRPTANIEPDKATLLEQIAQLKPILHEYEDVIMGVDGGFFGPWGEMHSTTFGQSPEAYAWLLDALLDAVPESRSLTVQGGAFLSWYNHHYGTHYTFENIDQIPHPERGTPEARFGFFNDSYAYGEDEGDNYPNDWGSLSEGAGWPGDPLGDEGTYDRGRIMTWIRNQNNFYGGEAQGDETLWNTYPFVAWEASYAQTVYLNADYEDQVHDRWGSFIYNEANVTKKMTNAYEDPYKTEYAIFDPVYDGRTGAEYWRDRLGYRLVLRDANASEWVVQNGTLRFKGKIQNVGFGNIVNKKNVSVILKAKDGSNTYTALTKLDARDWRPDLDSRASNTAAYRDLNFSIRMSAFDNVTAGDYDIYLKINDPKETSTNKRCIQFANHDIWNTSLGANLIGSTTVK